MLVALSQILRQLKFVDGMAAVNILLTVLIAKILVINLMFLKNVSHGITILLYYTIIFLGHSSLLIFMILSIAIKVCMREFSKMYFYYAYLFGHFYWWVQGNRYEYSSIDILQSYIFGTAYHPIINPICLCIYMMAPYFFLLLITAKTYF